MNMVKVSSTTARSKRIMDVERFPSGKFDTNELVLELTVLAYNILRVIGQKNSAAESRMLYEHSYPTGY